MNVLSVFCNGYSVRLYGRDVARRINESQRAISEKLKLLEENKILIVEEIGNLKLFSLNFDNFLTYELMCSCEILRTVSFLEENKQLSDAINELKNFVEGEILIGDLSKIKMKIFVFGEVMDGFETFSKKFPIKIERIELNELKNSLFYHEKSALEILENHVIINGINNLVNLFWRKKR